MSLAPDSLGPTLSIGEILVEIVATTAGRGFQDAQPLIGPFASGAPAIFIDQCGRFGGSAAMIGAVGDDDFGQLNVKRLEQDGVDVSGIRIDPVLPTGTAFVRYQSDGSRNFVFNMWTSAAGSLAWTEAVEALVLRSGHLHVMGTLLGQASVWPLIERAAELIKARGGSISLDPNVRKELKADAEFGERFERMVGLSDLLLPSGDEVFITAGLSPEAGEASALQRLFERGPAEIVLKRGSEGASSFEKDGRSSHAAAFSVEEIDPTGAGDCFGGAYVAARRLGLSVSQALDYGSAAGARNVTVRGPMEGAGTREQLDQFITNTPRRT
ncbi:MAG: sugar kinase [Rhodobacteraceae bacterium]|nr:sugar kinase [Paracoccaceae bacterium]